MSAAITDHPYGTWVDPLGRERPIELVTRYGVFWAHPEAWRDATRAEQIRRQGGTCALCAVPLDPAVPRQAHIDHCHKTGLIRGVLCARCNKAMVAVDDHEWLPGAIAYREMGGVWVPVPEQRPRLGSTPPRQRTR